MTALPTVLAPPAGAKTNDEVFLIRRSRTAYAAVLGCDSRLAVRTLLADRGTNGITVRLFWDETAPDGAELYIEYADLRENVVYVFSPPRDRALDAFYHPNAYRPLEAPQADAA
jgi:hypothetical protein